MFLNLICWIAIGLIAGFVARKVVDQRGDDPNLGLMVAAAGAAVCGFLYGTLLSATGVSAFNAASLWAAAVGAAVALVVWNLIRARASRA